MSKINKSAVDFRKEAIVKESEVIMKKMSKVSSVLDIFTDHTIDGTTPFEVVRHIVFSLIPESEIPLLSRFLADTKYDKKSYEWEYLETKTNAIRRNVRSLFLALDFKCQTKDAFYQQLVDAKSDLESYGELRTINREIIDKSSLQYLYTQNVDDSDAPLGINIPRFEIYLYQNLCSGLQAKEIFIEHSVEYTSLDELLRKPSSQEERIEILSEMGLDQFIQPASQHLGDLKAKMDAQIKLISDRVEKGENDFLRINPNNDQVRWTTAVKRKDDTETESFFSKFTQKEIIRVIRRVHQETGFLNALQISSSKNKKRMGKADSNDVIACLMANGTFQGLKNFAAISDRQYHALKKVEDDLLRPENIQAASDMVINASEELLIYQHLQPQDGKLHGSADGQKFLSRYDNYMLRHSKKYFGSKKGVVVYTLVTSFFGAKAKLISANQHESSFLYDVVYNNTSSLQPDIISTDNHGVSRYNFAIMNAFGFKFVPRFARFKRKFLNEFKVSLDAENIFSLKTAINWELIESEWENIVDILLSLGSRSISQSTLVKKLSSYQQSNAVMKAFAEYDRVYKCLYLMEYVDDRSVRQMVQETLNRGYWLYCSIRMHMHIFFKYRHLAL
jgi:TnpA family transposase